jgi:hypothetical protein
MMSTKNESTLYQLVNVFLPDGSWAGQFMNADAAKAWIKSQKLDAAKCEISRRRPEVKKRS